MSLNRLVLTGEGLGIEMTQSTVGILSGNEQEGRKCRLMWHGRPVVCWLFSLAWDGARFEVEAAQSGR